MGSAAPPNCRCKNPKSKGQRHHHRDAVRKFTCIGIYYISCSI
jgi:hypothetical protein